MGREIRNISFSDAFERGEGGSTRGNDSKARLENEKNIHPQKRENEGWDLAPSQNKVRKKSPPPSRRQYEEKTGEGE